jgi:hypothetical protein
MLGERLFSSKIRAAQMLRQRVIIMLFGDDPFSEEGVQRLDAPRRGGERAQQTVQGDAMPGQKFELRRERAAQRPDRAAPRRERPVNSAVRDLRRRAKLM